MTDWSLPTLDITACTACGRCVYACPEKVVVLRRNEPVFAHPAACTYCGLCEMVCPVDAITLGYAIVWDSSDRRRG